jgi:hypothetical protein
MRWGEILKVLGDHAPLSSPQLRNSSINKATALRVIGQPRFSTGRIGFAPGSR